MTEKIISHDKLCSIVAEQYRQTRNIAYLIETQQFKQVWSKCDAPDQKEALALIDNHDKSELHSWMNRHISNNYGEMPWKALIHHAKNHQIKNYSRLSRAELIHALEGVTNAEEGKKAREPSEGPQRQDAEASTHL